ncbi:hypothetical protein AAHA92_01924 [Salvia divinorum]|uniref:Uncharacterized protein n=1 Tax=Salvia divinorum TaxID=28513 RepID=A0ABD1IC45_SALDI
MRHTRIHLNHNPSLQTASIHTDPYIFTASLVEATEQLQDAISLILSSYYVGIDAEVAWKNCSGSVLNGWGEIQDVVGHVGYFSGGGKGKYEAGSSGSKDPEKQSG